MKDLSCKSSSAAKEIAGAAAALVPRANSKNAGSLRRLRSAYSIALPFSATACSTMSLSAFKVSCTTPNASPDCLTASTESSRSLRKGSRANSKAEPHWRMATKTSLSMRSSSGILANKFPFFRRLSKMRGRSLPKACSTRTKSSFAVSAMEGPPRFQCVNSTSLHFVVCFVGSW